MLEGREAYSDPFLSALIGLTGGSPIEKYYTGIICAFAAGMSLAIAHSLAKSSKSSEEADLAWGTKSLSTVMPIVLSLLTIVAIIYIVPGAATETQFYNSAQNIDSICSELFWIAIFSFTAKAALAISYDDEEETNAAHCRIMCTIGILYCFLVDRSLFAYTFTPEQIFIGVTIAVLTLVMLCIHARLIHDEDASHPPSPTSPREKEAPE